MHEVQKRSRVEKEPEQLKDLEKFDVEDPDSSLEEGDDRGKRSDPPCKQSNISDASVNSWEHAVPPLNFTPPP
ncbi:hypothetical protein SUGI_1090140 [Cryptomeria japonica]|nr:hypothetical protein SUGI_1090140 [Cryptomeria japonica]